MDPAAFGGAQARVVGAGREPEEASSAAYDSLSLRVAA